MSELPRRSASQRLGFWSWTMTVARMAEPARGQARDLETAAAQVHDALIECPMLDDIGNGTDVVVTLRPLYNEVVRDAG